MKEEIERNLGEQPLAGILAERGLAAKDLVDASTEQLTFKMVSRACKGRRLSANVKRKVQNALNAATGETLALSALFTY